VILVDYEVLGLASDGRHCLMIFCLGLHFFWSVSQMPMRRRSLFAHLMWLTTTRCSSLAPAMFVSQLRKSDPLLPKTQFLESRMVD